MAAQLLKRAAQLVAERGLTREAALAHLLNVVVKGRSGEVRPICRRRDPDPELGLRRARRPCLVGARGCGRLFP